MNSPVSLDAPQNCLIDGAWVAASQLIDVACPSNGEVFAQISAGGAAEIDAAVASGKAAFADWAAANPVDRGRVLTRLGTLIARDAEALAWIEAQDTGKPIAQARADMVAAARYFEYFGGAADKVHGETLPYNAGYQVQCWYEPYGVVGVIIPWNYPVQMFGRTVAPALAMGNTVVMKPAEDASLTTLRLAALALEAGLPNGVLNIVTGLGEVAGDALINHSGIDFISFTGSPEVGTLVQSAAARNHIDCTLELGGKSPQIVFGDADIEAALPVLANAIVQNGGQTCSAGSRILVEASFYDTLVARLIPIFEALEAGPHSGDHNLGALISARQKARVQGFLDRAEAPLLARGSIASNAPTKGHYIAPALFGPVTETCELAQDEVFGPVLSILTFTDEEDAIRIANATDYGLVAGIWTENGGRQMRMAKAMNCGQVFINNYGAGGGVELPFGGVRKSGHGREKGFVALHEFAQLKTVILKH